MRYQIYSGSEEADDFMKSITSGPGADVLQAVKIVREAKQVPGSVTAQRCEQSARRHDVRLGADKSI